ncbi:hypothetical protein SADUNF_Sadunf16G0265100 [Salix dunnii]|uniref:E3 ubiquitin-protein ligase RMA n=1 Tax=Salix dunnii TaxID=1413687 RepID=A0A835JDY3_9ROSI|nr:hypothetical protein SADUNF_Sadunf16G0265100 [Salix dunnii]
MLRNLTFNAELVDMEQHFFDHEVHFESEEDIGRKQKHKSIPVPPAAVSDNGSGYLECNICLDSAHDPVVTLCGHLYCWPCIYKWLHVKTSSPDTSQQQQSCPVCKAEISPNSLVPLYGRGPSSSESKSKRDPVELVIPRRPLPSELNHTVNTSTTPVQNQQLHSSFFNPQPQSFQHQQYFHDPHGGYAALTSSNLGGTVMTGFFNPMMGMFNEMVFTRIFGMSITNMFSHPYTNPLMGSNNPRIRRQEMLLDKALNRVSIFFLCCIILCLLLF